MLATSVVAFLVAGMTALPAAHAVDVFTYSLDESDNAIITGCASTCSVSLTIPSAIDGHPVTEIGASAFASSGITSVTFPSSLVTIGAHAFDSNEISTLSFPSGLSVIKDFAFQANPISSLIFPASITYLSQGAFAFISSLTSVTMLGNAPTGEWGVFYGSNNLQYIDVLESATGYGSYWQRMIRVKYSVTYDVNEQDQAVITGCSDTCPENLVIPSTIDGHDVVSIAGYAFDGESAITSVTLPESLTTIGYKAFWGASDLGLDTNGKPLWVGTGNIASVTFGSSVTTIGGYAFASQPSLTSITLPNSVTTVGPYAFRHDTGLETVDLGSGVTDLGRWAFHDCTSLTGIVIPEGVTSIGKATFFGADSLASVTISPNVTAIGPYAFSGTALTSVSIPNSVTTIWNSAFRGISALTSASVGSGVTSLGNYAFASSANLGQVTFAGNSPTTVSVNIFHASPNVTIRRSNSATGWGATLASRPVTTN